MPNPLPHNTRGPGEVGASYPHLTTRMNADTDAIYLLMEKAVPYDEKRQPWGGSKTWDSCFKCVCDCAPVCDVFVNPTDP